MPTVQTYQADQVRTQVAGTTQASTSQVPNALNSVAGAIDDVANMARTMQAEASFASAQEASNLFEREKNRIFFDPDNGYFNTQGKDAYDKAGNVTEQLEQLRKQYGKDLDQRARQEFDRVAGAMIQRSNVDIMRHSSKNLEAWKMANTQAEVENTIENASLYWNNIKQLDVQAALGRESVRELAERQGLSPEATNEKLQTYDSSFASTVITSALSKSAGDAEKAMELWGKRLEGPDLLSLQEKIAKKKEIETEQDMANQSVLQANKLVSQFGDRVDARSAMQEEINKIKDPDMQKRVRSEATYQLNLKQQADAEERGEIFEVAEGALYRGESMEEFKAKNPDSWDKLSPKQKKALESKSRIQTDYKLFSDLSLMSEDELAKINPSDYFDRLEPAERKQLITMVKEARQPDKKSVETQIGRSRQQQIRATVDQLFPDSDDKDLPQINRIYELIDNQYREAKSIKGAELNVDEFNSLIKSVSKEYVIKQSTLGFDWLNPDDRVNITNLTDEEIEKYSTLLSGEGLRVTPERIMRLYKSEKSE